MIDIGKSVPAIFLQNKWKNLIVFEENILVCKIDCTTDAISWRMGTVLFNKSVFVTYSTSVLYNRSKYYFL